MLFSTSYDAEKNLMEEIWGCFKYIGIPIDTLYKMPTRNRKYFIQLHNGETQKENAKHNKHNKSSMDINAYAKMEQENNINRSKR